MSQDWAALQAHLASMPRLALAYSGGLDSRFLAHAAQAAGCDVLLVHAEGAHVPEDESHFARQWAAGRGLALRRLPLNVLEVPGVNDNGRQRCYHCKQHLLKAVQACVQGEDRRICDGTNADDMLHHRPGLRALKEAGVHSPLAHMGLGKERLRQWGALTGLEMPEQKARPCLLTRLAYGLRPEASLLWRIAQAEKALAATGLQEFRLRLTPQAVLQTLPLACTSSVTAADLLAILGAYGFAPASLQEDDSISGFFDRS